MTQVRGAPIFKGKSFAPKRASASGDNSFDEALAAGGSLTGQTEEVTLYASVSISILTDGTGTVFLEQSADGTNFDDSETVLIAASLNKVITRSLTRRFYRTRFVSSSASPHTFLRLQTMYGAFTSDGLGTGTGGQAIRSSDILAQDTEADVPSGVTTTIVSFTAAVDTFITRIECSGHDYAKFTIEIDTAIKFTKRSGPSRDAEWDFVSPLKILAGQIVDVRVEHFYTGDVGDYDATVLGYT